MKFFRLTFINIKRYLKNPSVILISCILPIFMLLLLTFNIEDENPSIAIINNDKTEYSKELCKELKKGFGKIEYSTDLNTYIKKLKNSEIGAICVIDSEFGENLSCGNIPKVKVYILKETNGSIYIENIVNNYIEGIIDEEENCVKTVIKEEKSNEEYKYIMIMILICYFILIGSSLISEDVLKMKNQNILKRSLSIGNKDFIILGSILLAAFLVQSTLSIVSFMSVYIFSNIKLYSILNVIISLLLSTLLSTSIIIFTIRWIKKNKLYSVVIILYSIISMFIAIINYDLSSFEKYSRIIDKVSVLSPFTWIVNILCDKDILLSSIIVILMSVVFFTAGNFKLREFAD